MADNTTTAQSLLGRFARLTATIAEGRSLPRSLPQANDAYELYALCLLLHAATLVGCQVGFRNSGAGKSRSLTFRGNGGYLSGAGITYAVVKPPRTSGSPRAGVEVHVSTLVQGTSGVEHECDVAVLTTTTARASRHRTRGARAPTSRGLRAAIECKLFSRTVDLLYGRALLGMATDFGGWVKSIALVTTARPSKNIDTLFSRRPSGRPKMTQAAEVYPTAPEVGDTTFNDREASFVCKCIAFWRSQFGLGDGSTNLDDVYWCQTDGTLEHII